MNRLQFLHSTYLVGVFLIFGFFHGESFKRSVRNPNPEVGQIIDSLNGVFVFYNGDMANVVERNISPEGYNLGLKYQCVEFVKRYYYEYFDHKMPDSYGNAKDFFNASLNDGDLNKQRNLIQYCNHSLTRPEVGDILVIKATYENKFGHVAIVSKVTEDELEIIQQNPGPERKSRESFTLVKNDVGKWEISNFNVLGWLRKE